MIGRLHHWLSGQAQWRILLGSYAVIALLGYVDYITGYEMAFSIFFLLPVTVSGWYSSLRPAVVVCLVSAFTWSYVDHAAGAVYSQAWISVWNTCVRLGFFLVTLFLLNMLKSHLQNEAMLARTDVLTGVYNPRAFAEWLSHHIRLSARHGQPMTLGFIDLDDFKRVNDTSGHSTGDRLLRMVGQQMISTLRKTDVVGRLGGDEFAVLLPGVGADGAKALFDKLHGQLLDEMRSQGWQVGFSIGVAVFLQAPRSADSALAAADKLMYSVKNATKNGICYQVIEPEPPTASAPA